jgi:hypothetical protein
MTVELMILRPLDGCLAKPLGGGTICFAEGSADDADPRRLAGCIAAAGRQKNSPGPRVRRLGTAHGSWSRNPDTNWLV